MSDDDQKSETSPIEIDEEKIAEMVANHLKSKEPSEAVGLLMKDLISVRAKNRGLRAEIKTLKEAKPLLSDEIAQKYLDFGKPEEIKAKYDELDTLTEQETQREHEAVISQAATLHEMNPAVLTRLSGDLEFEIREEGTGKDKTEVAFVKNGDGTSLRLPDYAENNWKEFEASLAAEPAAPTREFPAQPGKPKPPTGRLNEDEVVDSKLADKDVQYSRF